MAKLIGTAPNQIPTNGDLGSMAFEDAKNYATRLDPIYQPYRNLIINGDMRIAQRGTSASVSGTGFTYDTVDRWRYGRVATQLVTSLSQSTDVPSGQGFANSLKLDVTTAETAIDAGDYARLQYAIEGQNLQHLKYGTASAENLTLSFWVKSSKTGNYNITLYRDESTDRMNVNNIVTISSANTWEKKTITLSGDISASITNDNGSRLLILLWLNAGSNYTSSSTSDWQNFNVATYASGHTATWGTSTSDDFYITGVQLEVGTEATPFEHRPYDMELQRCQRYYQKITGMSGYTAGTLTSIQCSVNYPIEMRATPDTSQSGVFRFDDGSTGFTQSATSIVYQGFQNNRGTIVGFGNFSFNGTYRPHGKANTATLNLDAEL